MFDLLGSCADCVGFAVRPEDADVRAWIPEPVVPDLGGGVSISQAGGVAEDFPEAHIDGAPPGDLEAVSDAAPAASDEHPPLPPPPHYPELPPKPDDDQLLVVPGGVLRWYKKLDKFQATCCHPRHDRCILSRTSESGRKLGQGRPLGLLTAWLKWGHEDPTVATKDDHWNEEKWPDFDTRLNAREYLYTVVGGFEMLACEREMGHNDFEPEVVA